MKELLPRLVLLCSILPILASCGSAKESKDGTLTLEARDGNYTAYHAGQPVFSYNAAPDLPAGLPEHYRRSGYLHPVYTPNGTVVTDGFPAGYAHQHGVFTAWTNNRFRGQKVDFWNTHQGTGAVAHQSTERMDTVGGPDGLKLRTTLHHYALSEDSTVVLRENLTVGVHDRNDVFVWDLTSEQRNVSTDTLYLLQHVYGGLGVRGSKVWNPKDSVNFTGPAEFITSEGMTRLDGNHTRPVWAAIYGEVAGATAGLAVLPHPDNIRYPQSVRLHPDLPYFSVSPVVVGDTAIAPGEVLVAQYRFVAFDGEVPDSILSQPW